MKKWLICLCWLPLCVPAIDDAPPVPATLTLGKAAALVLEHNPSLQAAGYDARAASARIEGARLSPAWRTALELENFGGSGVADGVDQLESTLSLSRVLETGDKAELRGEVAHGEALLLHTAQDVERLDVLAETAKRYIAVVSARHRLEISEASLALAQHTQKVVARRVEAGRAPDAELRRADIALARRQLEREQAQRRQQTARMQLAGLWGDTRVRFRNVQAALFDLDAVPGFDALEQQLQRNPELVKFATAERLAQSRSALAQAKSRPDIGVSAGLRHYNATDDLGLVVSLDIPLGTATRAASTIEAARLQRRRQPLAFEQRRLELHGTLFELYQEMQQAAAAVRTLRNTIIPQAESAMQDYENGYAAGRYSFLELTEAQRALLEARLEAVVSAAEYHRYRIEIDRLTGAGLSTGEPQ